MKKSFVDLINQIGQETAHRVLKQYAKENLPPETTTPPLKGQYYIFGGIHQ